MKKSRLLGAVCACVITMASVAVSAATVDQEQLLSDSGSAPVTTMGQSYTAGLTGLLSGITVFANLANPFTLSLYSGNAIDPGQLLASGQFTGSTIDVSSLGVMQTAGEQYTFNFLLSAGTSFSYKFGTNPYAGGDIKYNLSESSRLISDLKFITSVDTTVVPVPAAAWLFGSGLIGLIGVARRKKA